MSGPLKGVFPPWQARWKSWRGTLAYPSDMTPRRSASKLPVAASPVSRLPMANGLRLTMSFSMAILPLWLPGFWDPMSPARFAGCRKRNAPFQRWCGSPMHGAKGSTWRTTMSFFRRTIRPSFATSPAAGRSVTRLLMSVRWTGDRATRPPDANGSRSSSMRPPTATPMPWEQGRESNARTPC